MRADLIAWLLCVGGCAAAFTGIGIYAMYRKEPMFFWSGRTVRREELTDVKAYNRANGIMWLLYSVPMWVAAVLYFVNKNAAVISLVIWGTFGLGILIYAYHRIYEKYRRFHD